MPLSLCYSSLFRAHSLLLPQPEHQLTLNTPLSLSGPAGLFRAKQQCNQTFPNEHLRRCACAGVACQRPANTSRSRLSYCVLTVCWDSRQAEEKHSPHARMGYADHPTAGGACRGWCRWARRRGRGTRCENKANTSHEPKVPVYREWTAQGGARNSYFCSVMISLWPVYCHASRRARSLASELRFKGGKGYRELLSHYKIHTCEGVPVTGASVIVLSFTSH